MTEPQTQTCRSCNGPFVVTPDDRALYEKLGIPAPQECHICIWKNLLAFWMFGKFRKTTSAFSGKTIITTFSASAPFPLYDYEEWVSDAWDPLSYGQSYDLSRPFFEQFAEVQRKTPHPHRTGTMSENCEWSDDAWSCKNCYLCRSLLNCEDVIYAYRVVGCKNSVDVTFCFDVEYSYDCTYCFKSYRIRHAFDARDCLESAFLYDCRNVQNCFMCWNLRNKQYHILNRPYTKEEYGELVPRIIEHMNAMPYADSKGRIYRYGEFFPAELSPTAYNESKAQDYFPLRKEEVAERGYLWFDIERREFQTTMQAQDLPDDIADAKDSIVNEKIECISCKRAYRIIPPELALHRRFGIPLPRLCFACRYTRLLRHRNPLKLWHRACQCVGMKSENGIYQNTATHQHGAGKCPNEFETSYAPDRKEIVYCEQCYNAEVV